MTMKKLCAIVSSFIAGALLLAGTAEADSGILMIPAAAFSTDGEADDNFINYGDHLYTRSDANLYFHAWVKLPNLATITNIDMMTRDDATGTITGYLKRVKFGADSSAETLLTFTSPGNIGCASSTLCHDMEGSLEITVDTANYAYWFDVYVPYAPGYTAISDYLQFWAVRIMYNHDDLIFGDTLESGDTVMWSSSTGTAKAGVAFIESSEENDRLALQPSIPTDRLMPSDLRLFIEDPRAQEAMELAAAGKAGYASPYVIAGPAFKSTGYLDFNRYDIHEIWGCISGRENTNGADMHAPVNLPTGAHISWYMVFYVDSIRSAAGSNYDIRFWLSRMDSLDPLDMQNMVYEITSGNDTAIRSITVDDDDMELAVPGSATVDNSKYSYWVTVDVGPFDGSPPSPYEDEDWWHKVYAIVILYTMP